MEWKGVTHEVGRVEEDSGILGLSASFDGVRIHSSKQPAMIQFTNL